MTEPRGSALPPTWARWYRRALPAYWVFLFCVTHFPKLTFGPRAPKWTDKAAHFVAFGLLAFLFWRFNEALGRAPGRGFVWAAGGLLLAYAAVDEYLQGFVGRGADALDWLMDGLGIGVALTALELRRRRRWPRPAAVRGGA